MSEFPIVHVKNLPYDASTQLIHELFSKFGHIHQIRISDGSAPAGTCFVIFSDMSSAAKAAKEVNGVNFRSRYLITHLHLVDKAKVAS